MVPDYISEKKMELELKGKGDVYPAWAAAAS